MKKIPLVLALLISASSFAADITGTCTVLIDKKHDGSLWTDTDGNPLQTFKLEINGGNAVLNAGPKNQIKGAYTKVATDGYYVFNSQDVADLADQTSGGSILVDPRIMGKKSGYLTLSTYQMGDSEGGNWLTDSFYCVINK